MAMFKLFLACYNTVYLKQSLHHDNPGNCNIQGFFSLSSVYFFAIEFGGTEQFEPEIWIEKFLGFCIRQESPVRRHIALKAHGLTTP